MTGARFSLAAASEANKRRATLIRHVRAVYRLGERATFEMVDQIARDAGCRALVERVAEEIAGIDSRALRATGGDRFLPPPLRVVGGRR